MYVASAARIWNRDSFCCGASSLSRGFFNLVENVVLQQRRIRILFTIALQCRCSQSSATKSEHFSVPRSQSCVQVFARYFWLHSPLGTAHAKFSFLPQYVSRWGDHAPFRHNHQHTQNLNRPKQISLRKHQRAHSRLSFRSQTNGSRFMTTAVSSHGLQ